MNELQLKTITISSIEVAEMVDKEHKNLLADIRTYISYMEKLGGLKIQPSDYFIESKYINKQNKEQPCYEVTKLGCEMIANKLTGEKGIIFTALYVKRFNDMAEYIKEKSINQIQSKIPFTEIVQSIDIVANSLKVNDASKILMYDKLYNSYGVSTEFLPKYENNGSRELKSATELLKRINSNIKTAVFNQLLIKNGYLEERTRKSTKSDEPRYFKALTEKGLHYGENLISPRNQREVQPCYYTDKFQELYNLVNEKAGVLA